MQEQKLTLEADLRSFFRELVDQTLEGRAERPAPDVQQYLIGLLEDSATSRGEGFVEATLRGPLAVQLSQALHAPAGERFERLVRLGDGILVVGGLFEPHLRRNGMDERYISAMGARAYASASSLLSSALSSSGSDTDVLGRLAAEFRRLMALLRDVSDTILARSARTAHDWSRLCEKWLLRRTAHLERLLVAQGISVNHLSAVVA